MYQFYSMYIACSNSFLVRQFVKFSTPLNLPLIRLSRLDTNSFIIYSIIIIFHKTYCYFFSVQILKFISPGISFQNRIDNKYFSWPIFSVTFTKNILDLVILTLSLNLNVGALGFVSIFSIKAE